jgi:hypothetical protein
MNVQDFSNNEIEEALERYDDLYTEALNNFDYETMNAVLEPWLAVEAEAISRGLIEKVDA